MVIATFVGGIFMMAVHTVAGRMGEEYSTFVTLLRLLIIMGIPASALQTIFARQAAAVTHEKEEQQLTATTRAVLGWSFILWLVVGVGVLVATRPLCRLIKISNPAALWFTLGMGLTTLWVPILKGLLQGKHRFGELGWMQIVDGMARFSVVLLMVAFLHAKAAGGMFAAFSAQFLTVAFGIVMTYGLWKTKATVSFHWKKWLREAGPLTLGLGAILLMSSIDMVFVQGLFSDANSTALYGGAMLTGYAIIQFIAPVSLVMFARVAQSVARAERTDTLGMTLGATILFGAVAAIGCTMLPWLPLKMIYLKNPEMMRAAPLVPWFAWALLPLTVANVLVQNILARGKFKAVPWLCLVPVVYAISLRLQSHHLLTLPPMIAFVRVIETLGLASLAMCAVAAWFSWGGRQTTVLDPGSAVGHSISDTASSRAE